MQCLAHAFFGISEGVERIDVFQKGGIMKAFDLFFDLKDDMAKFGETESDMVARLLEEVVSQIREKGIPVDGSFTYLVKDGARALGEGNIAGGYRLK